MKVCGIDTNFYELYLQKTSNSFVYDLKIDISSLLCFSCHRDYFIFIEKDRKAFIFGKNIGGVVMNANETIKERKEIILKDSKGSKFNFHSVVSSFYYSLFLVSSENSHNNQLACSLSLQQKSKKKLFFLNINGQNPIQLFGGSETAAAINSDGSIIIISKAEILKNQNKLISSIFLPNREKPVSIAIMKGYIIVVSKSYHVFMSSLSEINFKIVDELEGKNIMHVSAYYKHCLALSTDGKVFGFGDNDDGQIGIGKGQNNAKKFIEVTKFGKHKIKSVSAGYMHSLFLTTEGKVFGSGFNGNNEMPLSEDNFYLPTELPMIKDCTFCFAGGNCSLFIIGHEPPSKMANTPLTESILKPPKLAKTVTEKSDTKQDADTDLKRENADLRAEIASLKEKIKSLTKQESKKSQPTTVNSITILDSSDIHGLRISREISVGGSGKVVEVIKEEKYALKMMNINDKSVSNQRKFIREYELLNMLKHPNIIKTYGVFLSDADTPTSILLELCSTDLNHLIKNDNPTNCDIVKYIYQISEAMRYVHFCGLVHRDLKPQNILISKDGLIRVSDFGIARLMTTEEQSTTLGAGTQKFMAPEILKEEDYNEKADVYSFGVILYFILSGGKMPKINIIDIGIGKKASIPSSFTKFAHDLINDCWNYDPKTRPSFKLIVEQMIKANFNFFEFRNAEVKDIKEFVKQHREKIPSYND